MLNWQITPIKLELKYTWKISRNSSTHKTNFIINCGFNKWAGIGEVAPNIRYNETPDIIAQEFETFIKAGGNKVHDIHELTELLNKLKLKNALRFGIESAYIHMLCNAEKTPIHQFLGIEQAHNIETSYTLPIMEIDEVATFYNSNKLDRFSVIKLKTNADNGPELIKHITSFCNKPLIIDGNEAYKNADELLHFLDAVKHHNIVMVEQPMPAICEEDYKAAKKQSPFPLMADESVCDEADFELIAQQFDFVNMKLMKAGGYLNGLHIINEAKNHGLKTMIGCMVETSLGISSAFNMCSLTDYADLDGYLIVKDEPFRLLHEENGKINLSR
ncbi:MAG: dipeptide epimerase [Bacteroidia bacterium]|nr:dipeptide epimerase [Bacteroidia bacterium]